jgi:hypothetical protein
MTPSLRFEYKEGGREGKGRAGEKKGGRTEGGEGYLCYRALGAWAFALSRAFD